MRQTCSLLTFPLSRILAETVPNLHGGAPILATYVLLRPDTAPSDIVVCLSVSIVSAAVSETVHARSGNALVARFYC
jgi:hypothetical protein